MRTAKALLPSGLIALATALWPSPSLHAAPTPSPPRVAGEAAFLMDLHSEHVLAQKKPDKPWPPASLAKMMTLYTLFEAIESGSVAMDDRVRVSKKAWKAKGSRMFLEPGDKVTLHRLIKGIIVESGNDACIAAAEHVAGTEQAFVQLMNNHAQELGLENSHFANSTGLPAEGMKATARELAHIAKALIREFPDYYEMFAIRKMTYNDITQYNRNRLMWWDDSVDGLKTGHTERAGYGLVASAEREGRRLISVVLGAESERSRAEASQSLLNYGFRFYRTYRLYQAGKPIHKAPVWKGQRRQVGVTLKRDLYVTVPRGKRDRIDITLELRQPLLAPLKAGEQVGRLQVDFGDKPIAERALITRRALAQGGLFRWMVDSVRLWLPLPE